jgi:GxxExxY protein
MHPLFEKASSLTETIIAAAIEVHRDKGPGLLESIYEWCLIKELELRGLNCISQKTVVIRYKQFTREETLRFDVLVEGCVLVEGKAVEKAPHPQGPGSQLHEAARCARRPSHQLPRNARDRRGLAPDSPWSKPLGVRCGNRSKQREQRMTLSVSSVFSCSMGAYFSGSCVVSSIR